MSKSLKEQNAPRLIAVCTLNAAVFLGVVHSGQIAVGGLSDVMALLPAPLAVSLLAVVNGLLGSETKARIVFFRWSNPLPGSRAFTEHAREDPRIDVDKVRRRLGGLPRAPDRQNSAWYELYKAVQSDAAVCSNHRDYLFTRDYATLAALYLVPLAGLAIALAPAWKISAVYVALLVAQFLVVRFVAARYGRRLVTTALAVSTAEA